MVNHINSRDLSPSHFPCSSSTSRVSSYHHLVPNSLRNRIDRRDYQSLESIGPILSINEKAIGAICCEFMMTNSGHEGAKTEYALELLIHFLGHFPNREGYQKLKNELEEVLEWQKKIESASQIVVYSDTLNAVCEGINQIINDNQAANTVLDYIDPVTNENVYKTIPHYHSTHKKISKKEKIESCDAMFERSSQLIADLSNQISNKIKSLPVGTRMLIPGGFNAFDKPDTHFLLYEVFRERNTHYSFTIYNSGDGLFFHHRLIRDVKCKYLQEQKIKAIPFEVITDPQVIIGLLRPLITPRVMLTAYCTTQKYIRQDFLNDSIDISEWNYERLFQQVFGPLLRSGKLDRSPLNLDDLMTDQRSGSCWISPCFSMLRRSLGLLEYKRFKCELKACVLNNYFKHNRYSLRDHPEKRYILKKASANLAKTLEYQVHPIFNESEKNRLYQLCSLVNDAVDRVKKHVLHPTLKFLTSRVGKNYLFPFLIARLNHLAAPTNMVPSAAGTAVPSTYATTSSINLPLNEKCDKITRNHINTLFNRLSDPFESMNDLHLLLSIADSNDHPIYIKNLLFQGFTAWILSLEVPKFENSNILSTSIAPAIVGSSLSKVGLFLASKQEWNTETILALSLLQAIITDLFRRDPKYAACFQDHAIHTPLEEMMLNDYFVLLEYSSHVKYLQVVAYFKAQKAHATKGCIFSGKRDFIEYDSSTNTIILKSHSKIQSPFNLSIIQLSPETQAIFEETLRDYPNPKHYPKELIENQLLLDESLPFFPLEFADYRDFCLYLPTRLEKAPESIKFRKKTEIFIPNDPNENLRVCINHWYSFESTWHIKEQLSNAEIQFPTYFHVAHTENNIAANQHPQGDRYLQEIMRTLVDDPLGRATLLSLLEDDYLRFRCPKWQNAFDFVMFRHTSDLVEDFSQNPFLVTEFQKIVTNGVEYYLKNGLEKDLFSALFLMNMSSRLEEFLKNDFPATNFFNSVEYLKELLKDPITWSPHERCAMYVYLALAVDYRDKTLDDTHTNLMSIAYMNLVGLPPSIPRKKTLTNTFKKMINQKLSLIKNSIFNIDAIAKDIASIIKLEVEGPWRGEWPCFTNGLFTLDLVHGEINSDRGRYGPMPQQTIDHIPFYKELFGNDPIYGHVGIEWFLVEHPFYGSLRIHIEQGQIYVENEGKSQQLLSGPLFLKQFINEDYYNRLKACTIGKVVLIDRKIGEEKLVFFDPCTKESLYLSKGRLTKNDHLYLLGVERTGREMSRVLTTFEDSCYIEVWADEQTNTLQQIRFPRYQGRSDKALTFEVIIDEKGNEKYVWTDDPRYFLTNSSKFELCGLNKNYLILSNHEGENIVLLAPLKYETSRFVFGKGGEGFEDPPLPIIDDLSLTTQLNPHHLLVFRMNAQGGLSSDKPEDLCYLAYAYAGSNQFAQAMDLLNRIPIPIKWSYDAVAWLTELGRLPEKMKGSDPNGLAAALLAFTLLTQALISHPDKKISNIVEFSDFEQIPGYSPISKLASTPLRKAYWDHSIDDKNETKITYPIFKRILTEAEIASLYEIYLKRGKNVPQECRLKAGIERAIISAFKKIAGSMYKPTQVIVKNREHELMKRQGTPKTKYLQPQTEIINSYYRLIKCYLKDLFELDLTERPEIFSNNQRLLIEFKSLYAEARVLNKDDLTAKRALNDKIRDAFTHQSITKNNQNTVGTAFNIIYHALKIADQNTLPETLTEETIPKELVDFSLRADRINEFMGFHKIGERVEVLPCEKRFEKITFHSTQLVDDSLQIITGTSEKAPLKIYQSHFISTHVNHFTKHGTLFSRPANSSTATSVEDREIQAFELNLSKGAEKLNNIPHYKLKHLVSIEELVDLLREDCRISSADLSEKREFLLHFANQLPIDETFHLDAKISFESKGYKPVEFHDILRLYLQENIEEYQRATFLSFHEIQNLHQKTFEYLIAATTLRQKEEALSLSSKIQTMEDDNATDKAHAIDRLGQLVFTERWDDEPDTTHNTSLLVLEYAKGLLLRKQQVDVINTLTKKQSDGSYDSTAVQLVMGGGKTKVLLPILAQEAADGINIPLILVPQTLYQANYQDLSHSSMSLFGKRVFSFEFDRTTPIKPEKLNQIKEMLFEVKAQKSYIITTPESLQCFELRYFELINDCPNTKNLNKVDRTTMIQNVILMEDILNDFQNHGQAILDEADTLLSCRRMVNFTLGNEKKINKQHIHLIGLLYQWMLDFNVPIPSNTQHLYKVEDVLDHLASKLYMTYQKKLPRISERRFKDYILENNTRLPKWVKNSPIADHIGLMKKSLSILLPLCLSKKGGEHYGLSLNDPSIHYAIPYRAVTRPNEGSEFGNPYETLFYTYQYYLQKGVSCTLIEKWMLDLRKKMDDEIAMKNNLPSDTQAGKLFIKMTGLPINFLSFEKTTQFTYNHIISVQGKINSHIPSLIKFVSTEVAPTIHYHSLAVSSDAQNLCSLVKSIRAFSGTLWNTDSFPDYIKAIPDIGTEGQIAHVIIDRAEKKGNDYIKVDTTSANTLLVHLNTHPDASRIRAIIDCGALFEGQSNYDVAANILSFYADKKQVNAVLYFDEETKLPAILQKGNDQAIHLNSTDYAHIEAMGITPENLFTYYDQANTTGTDIKQAQNSVAVMTWSSIGLQRDYFQGAMRMRGLLDSQEIIHAVHESEHLKMSENLGYEMTKGQDCIIHATLKQARQVAEDNYNSIPQKMDQILRSIIKSHIMNAKTLKLKSKLLKCAKESDFIITKVDHDSAVQLNSIYFEQKTLVVLKRLRYNLLNKFYHSFKQHIRLPKSGKLKSEMKKPITHLKRKNGLKQMVYATHEMNHGNLMNKEILRQVSTEIKQCVVKEIELQLMIEKTLSIQYAQKEGRPNSKWDWSNIDFTNFDPHNVNQLISLNQALIGFIQERVKPNHIDASAASNLYDNNLFISKSYLKTLVGIKSCLLGEGVKRQLYVLRSRRLDGSLTFTLVSLVDARKLYNVLQSLKNISNVTLLSPISGKVLYSPTILSSEEAELIANCPEWKRARAQFRFLGGEFKASIKDGVELTEWFSQKRQEEKWWLREFLILSSQNDKVFKQIPVLVKLFKTELPNPTQSTKNLQLTHD